MSDRAKYWRRLVAAWEKSGLTQAEFCRRRGIEAVNFGWWKRKLSMASKHKFSVASKRKLSVARDQGRRRRMGRRSAGGGQPERAEFVEVALPSRVLTDGPTSSIFAAAPCSPCTMSGGNTPSSSATGYEIVLPGGPLIRLPADFDPDRVCQLIHAVASAC